MTIHVNWGMHLNHNAINQQRKIMNYLLLFGYYEKRYLVVNRTDHITYQELLYDTVTSNY